VHQLLRAHGAGIAALRANGAARAGIVLNLEPKVPASDAPEDRAAAERADHYMNRLFLDPILRGRYPERLSEIFGDAWPHAEADLSCARAPLDFLGVNYYTRSVVRHDDDAYPTRARSVPQPGSIYTTTGWEVDPDSLERLLIELAEQYEPIPLYVTENGAAFYDPPRALEGRVEDPLRTDYLVRHVRAVARAIDRGVDVRGYFAWSLLDNYEWAAGFSKRFGIVHVDFETQKRTVKTSGELYREIVASHGGALGRDR
jgi:beta-glucosidase